MPNHTSLHFGIAALAFVLVATLAPHMARAQSQNPPADQQAQPTADSAADAARKAKADKPKPAKKVFTDDDISSLKSGGLSVVGEKASDPSPADAGKSGAKPISAATSKNAKDEAYWRGRAQKIRDQMNAVDQEIATLRDEIKKGGNAGFDAQSGRNQNVVFFEDRSAKLRNLEKKRDDLQKQMDALEEEARRADVPIGWLR
jgi:hypothetical protein